MINPIVAVRSDGTRAYIQPALYPAGEVRLPEIPEGDVRVLRVQLESAQDREALMQLAEYYMNRGASMPDLVMPYIPYARQDRRSSAANNASLSIKAFAWWLNSMRWNSVTVSDPHSNVSTAVLDRVVAVERKEYVGPFMQCLYEDGIVPETLAIVAPDTGALKQTEAIANMYKIPVMAFAQKHRDEATGQIGPMTIPDGEKLRGKHILICDDICDGGGTFAGLAQALAPYEPASLNLYITHGVFSKGLDPLVDYKRIYSPFPFNGYKHLRAQGYWLPGVEYDVFSTQDVPPYESVYYRRK